MHHYRVHPLIVLGALLYLVTLTVIAASQLLPRERPPLERVHNDVLGPAASRQYAR